MKVLILGRKKNAGNFSAIIASHDNTSIRSRQGRVSHTRHKIRRRRNGNPVEPGHVLREGVKCGRRHHTINEHPLQEECKP